MARTSTTGSIDSEIQKVKQNISKTKARYDELAESLQKLEKQKRAMQADKIMDAFEKSGKSYQELMTFLGAYQTSKLSDFDLSVTFLRSSQCS